ncbi:MAG: von Willebrand factor type A [candidate division TM6 bacterium GW2011_GWE2_42_60]|nr:MAG: von Willebrand factor type A [candidate division TM6 bacterium GW2011_GWE2_42_60]HBY05992.1 aerotolerance regulator BatA [Candidatus Dependentiae bacterium]
MILRFLYPLVFIFGSLLLIGTWFFLRYWRRHIRYVYPFVSFIKARGVLRVQTFSIDRLAKTLRWLALFLLLGVVARPQWCDESSRVKNNGRDIVLALDVSGSMQLFDDLNDRRIRFDVAKAEVARFIDRRTDDQIGLVLFGAAAFSRCPLTYDKRLLQNLVQSLQLGLVNPNGTVLSVALAMAVNRLRASPAKSKIIIMLTDGAPTPQDIEPGPVIELAKKGGIKVYTIGVGGSAGGYSEVPFHGVVQCDTPRNDSLLKEIAEQTGGRFFKAERPDDVAHVYGEIDALEKTEYTVPLYTRYRELAPFLLLLVLSLLAGEIAIRWVWVLP